MIKEYSFGVNKEQGFYYIDSNILVALGNYYYRGKCKSKELTEEIVEFLLTARRFGVQNQFSLMELCYDYGFNSINVEMMQKIMIAYDELITNMNEREIRLHKGVQGIEITNSDDHVKCYKTIYDCNLPDFLFGKDGKDFKRLFYCMYLYMLKIYDLYNNHSMSGMEKMKDVFDFMTEEIDILLANEILTASLLFLGNNEEKNIVKKILKPREKPELKHIMNATMDFFQYKMAEFSAQLYEKMGTPMFVKFATEEKALQDYIERVLQYNIVISNNMLSSLNEYEFDILPKYEAEWKEYYFDEMIPRMKKRYLELHLKRDTKDINALDIKLKENIRALERNVL